MKNLLTLFFAISLSTTALAQDAVGVYASVFKPLADYDRNLDKNPVGLTFNGLKQMKNERLRLGGELGVAMYANRQYSYELVDEGYPGEFVDVDEEDCFLTVHGVARYTLLDNGILTTYAEAKAGISSFFSSRIALEQYSHFRDQTRFHGTAVNTSVGAGINIDVKRLFTGSDSFNPIMLDFTTTVNSGSRARYRNMNADDLLVTSVSHGNYRSLTNNIQYKIGILVEL